LLSFILMSPAALPAIYMALHFASSPAFALTANDGKKKRCPLPPSAVLSGCRWLTQWWRLRLSRTEGRPKKQEARRSIPYAKEGTSSSGTPIASHYYIKAASGRCTASVTIQSTAQRSTAQHSTAQHSTAQHQHSTAQHSTAQHSTAQHSTAQHSTAQHSTAQHSTAQHSTHSGVAHLLRYGTISAWHPSQSVPGSH
jgi:hypothetical protein